MPLSDNEQALIAAAGTTPDPTKRRQAVVAVLHQSAEEDRRQARALLGASYLAATQPSFHLIPRGDAMVSEPDFITVYDALAACTANFADVSEETLERCLLEHPGSLVPLRMIAGLTRKELAAVLRMMAPGSRSTEDTVRRFEEGAPHEPASATRAALTRAALGRTIAGTIRAVMSREVLVVPPDAQAMFHSKLDRRDTQEGWVGVNTDATHGVPYSALLYQRYIGGAWRQVQDAYSEVKGDNILELPLERLLEDERIPYYRTPSGATGAAETTRRYGISPGPDFVIPDESPSVVIESKVAEDGGTVRDKASRIKDLSTEAKRKGLVVCALVDGRGWSERVNALVEVIIATDGRTYTLNTITQLLDVPEIGGLRGTRGPH